MNYGRFSVWLNGQGLQDIDETVFVLDVAESTPDEDKQTATTAAPGSLLLARTRRALSVTITFCVREYDITRRRQIVDEIRTLCAAGGWLEINERPDQRLWVVYDTLPTISSSQRWTENLSVVFVAYAAPYWQQKTATTVQIPLTSSMKINMRPIGNGVETPLDAEVTASGGTITSLKFTVNDGIMLFSNINIKNGNKLVISHDQYGIISAKVGENSILANRLPTSIDDLIVVSGKNNSITVSSSEKFTAKLTAYGRWI